MHGCAQCEDWAYMDMGVVIVLETSLAEKFPGSTDSARSQQRPHHKTGLSPAEDSIRYLLRLL